MLGSEEVEVRAMGWVVFGVLAGCASDGAPVAGAEGPTKAGPMRPMEADRALDEAPGLGLDDEAAVRSWLEARVAAARTGRPERVKLPLVREAEGRAASLAADVGSAPRYAVAASDLTSAGGLVYARPGALLWGEGRFTGELRDDGAPVVEVWRVMPRPPEDAAVLRVVEGAR